MFKIKNIHCHASHLIIHVCGKLEKSSVAVAIAKLPSLRKRQGKQVTWMAIQLNLLLAYQQFLEFMTISLDERVKKIEQSMGSNRLTLQLIAITTISIMIPLVVTKK